MSTATALWRWFFPTIVLGILLPVGLGLLVVGARADNDRWIGDFFANGDLFLLTVAVLGSAWGQIAPISDRREISRDLLVVFLASATGAWAFSRAFQQTADPLPQWVTLWCGAICLSVALLAGVGCTVARERSGR